MRIGRFLVSTAAMSLAVLAAGCAGTATSVSSSTADTLPAQQAPANGPQYRVAVSAFDYRGMQRGDIGQGMADMLAGALSGTGRYIPAGAGDGQAPGAQWLISGSVNAFEPACSAGSQIIVSGNQACVSINLKIVDAASGRVIKAINIDGSSDGSRADAVLAGGDLPAGLAAYRKMPMEQALRSCIDKAVRAIAALNA